MQEFRNFLTDAKLPYTEKELVENNEWVRSSIKSELFVGAFGQQEGMRVQAEADPNVLKALELMPKPRNSPTTRARPSPSTTRRGWPPQQLNPAMSSGTKKGTAQVPFLIAAAWKVLAGAEIILASSGVSSG